VRENPEGCMRLVLLRGHKCTINARPGSTERTTYPVLTRTSEHATPRINIRAKNKRRAERCQTKQYKNGTELNPDC
jgi:hypothetical protein